MEAAQAEWLGHATVLLSTGGLRILTDPVLGRWIGPLRRSGPLPRASSYSGVNLVLVSHAHHDHLDLRSLRLLRRLNPGARLVMPSGTGGLGRAAGWDDVTELRPGDELTEAGTRIAAVPAHHEGGRTGSNVSAPALGYLVGDTWFAGDTGLHDGMADLAGAVDLALVPTGGWGLTLGPHHMDARQAAEACARVGARRAMAVHWGTFGVPGTRVPVTAPLWRRQAGSTFAAALAEVSPATAAA